MKSKYNIHFYLIGEKQTFSGVVADDIVEQLRLRDWAFPRDVLEFKRGMAKNVELFGYTIVFWDATSFLYALEGAGVGYVMKTADEVKP